MPRVQLFLYLVFYHEMNTNGTYFVELPRKTRVAYRQLHCHPVTHSFWSWPIRRLGVQYLCLLFIQSFPDDLSQVVTGKCGGFPGTCLPSVGGSSKYSLRFRLASACQPTDGSLHPCYNGGTCIAKTLVSYECQCPTGWTGSRCAAPESKSKLWMFRGIVHGRPRESGHP